MSKKDINCPVCGYYCLGKGGHGCIDKPALCGHDISSIDELTQLRADIKTRDKELERYKQAAGMYPAIHHIKRADKAEASLACAVEAFEKTLGIIERSLGIMWSFDKDAIKNIIQQALKEIKEG